MLDLNAVKKSLEAQLVEARKGRAYYEAVELALEASLSQLEMVHQAAGLPSSLANKLVAKTANRASVEKVIKQAAAKPAKASKKAASTPGKPAKKTLAPTKVLAKKAKGADKLPKTGTEFWTSLLSSQPQSMQDVLGAAFAKLGVASNKEQMAKLKNRATFTLNELVKKNLIKDQGSGRDRRFLM